MDMEVFCIMEDKKFEGSYARYYDLFNKNKDYKKEIDFLEQVFKKFNLKNKKVLDLGCGTGLHEKELSDRIYEMTGLDLSPDMIEIAKEKTPNVKFVVGDMSNFELNEKFDSIICMFSAIGYLTENKQIENFFKCVKRHLNPNGLLIIDCWNGLGVMHELPTSREKIVEVKGLKIVRRSFPDLDVKNHINNVKFEVEIFKNDNLIKKYEEIHKVRFFFPKELEKYMNDEEFELIHLCPSYEFGEELTEKHWNMILVGRI
ncbi:MAG: class I SAM-dependent methyltransferase [Nanoarchaeota archaeon]|nr:class I SAM-dependent methyltransferase [Nanoarchaeota archaeon]